jgi:hypothetical protein
VQILTPDYEHDITYGNNDQQSVHPAPQGSTHTHRTWRLPLDVIRSRITEQHAKKSIPVPTFHSHIIPVRFRPTARPRLAVAPAADGERVVDIDIRSARGLAG